MKKLTIASLLLLIVFTLVISAQFSTTKTEQLLKVRSEKQQKKILNEEEVMFKNHIDFTKEYIQFKIHGLIEIDGHIFKNDTCTCYIIYKADLEGVTLINSCSKVQYTRRICKVPNCPVIHLVEKEKSYITAPNWNSLYLISDTIKFMPW
jgi:hypothetical protein